MGSRVNSWNNFILIMSCAQKINLCSSVYVVICEDVKILHSTWNGTIENKFVLLKADGTVSTTHLSCAWLIFFCNFVHLSMNWAMKCQNHAQLTNFHRSTNCCIGWFTCYIVMECSEGIVPFSDIILKLFAHKAI